MTLPTADPRAQKLQADFDESIRSLGLESLAEEVGIKPIDDGRASLEFNLAKILTVDDKMLEIKNRIRKFAPKNLPILILGETGAGKEYIAKALHGNRFRATFKSINCGAIPSELLESELFGYKKGAFTGAVTDKKGLIEKANRGTLFLDEIGDMPLLLQCKMLRVLQEKTYTPIGSDEEKTVDFRVISATNHLDLGSKETFREDLYYRLAGHIIKVPPLRERRLDIGLIVAAFCEDMALRDRIMIAVENSPLKGNVRELLNIIEEYKILYL